MTPFFEKLFNLFSLLLSYALFPYLYKKESTLRQYLESQGSIGFPNTLQTSYFYKQEDKGVA